jgi:hypothetical protein
MKVLFHALEARLRRAKLAFVPCLWLVVMFLQTPVNAQTAFIGPDTYAFQYQPGVVPTSVGLFFNSSAAQYEFRDLSGAAELAINPIQQRSYFRGDVGLNIALPEARLHVIGDARLGASADYLNIDAAGNLRFVGAAGYRVASNSYAFQAEGSQAGLFFNVLENEFQFIDGDGDAILAILATGFFAGQTRIEQDLNVAGNLALGTPGNFSRLSAISTGGGQRVAVRGEGFNDQTYGYLGVVGQDAFDGTSLDLAGDEIGALGIALGGSPSSDNIGVQGHADGVGIRASHSNGLGVDLATEDYALEAFGDARVNGNLISDSSTLSAVFVDNIRDAVPGSVPPVLVGATAARRLGFYKDAIQTESGVGYSRLDINPLGGDVYIAEGGGSVYLADAGPGEVNIALGGGAVNLGNVLFTDPATNRTAIGDPTPDYTFAVQHPIGTGIGNGFGIINELSGTSWSMYSFISGDLGLFESDSLKGRFDNVSGNYTVTSDRRLKTDVRDIDNAHERVLALRPRSYRFRADASGERQYYGFIAQELEEVLPDLVHRESETGLRSVSYTEVIPLLVAAHQEIHQQQQTATQFGEQERNQQEAQIQQLQRELETATHRLERLEALLGIDDAGHLQGSSAMPVGASSAKAWGVLEAPWPNPSADVCHVAYRLSPELGQAVLEAFDAQGRSQWRKSIPVLAEGQVSIPTADWPAGTYRIRLLGEGRMLDAATLQVQR